MKNKQHINYILIIIGALVAMYAKVDANPNTFVLIGGICILMFGMYRLSQSIPSKKHKEDDFKSDEHD